MGMFNWVNYKAPCPNCGMEITDWQTKEGYCHMVTIEPWQVKLFYTTCPYCNIWIDANVDAEVEQIVNIKHCTVTLTIDRENSIGTMEPI
jgi:hypothetical protein